MKKSKLFIVVAVILLMVATIGIISFDEQASVSINKTIVPKGDAIVTNIWINETGLLRVKKLGFRYLIVDIGGFDERGNPTSNSKEIGDFLNLVRDFNYKNNYSFILLPYSEINTEKIDISNEEFKKNFVASFKNLYFRGFNGILVDIEPVSYGYRDDYLDILDRLNKDLPETAIISAYAVSISREPTNEWQWDPYFYYDVAERVDLISASGYDAFLQKDKYYYHYVRMQVMQLNQINENFLFGIPTHKQYPETPEMTLRAYNSVRGNNFIGVAVFSEWTADEKELAVIKPYLNNTWS